MVTSCGFLADRTKGKYSRMLQCHIEQINKQIKHDFNHCLQGAFGQPRQKRIIGPKGKYSRMLQWRTPAAKKSAAERAAAAEHGVCVCLYEVCCVDQGTNACSENECSR